MDWKSLEFKPLKKDVKCSASNSQKNCLKDEKLKKFFPIKKNKHAMKKRNTMMFQTNKTRTERYRRSAIPYMQRLLNKEENSKIWKAQ